ncbi:MAG: DUF2541 domain-containing protein [Hyphomicrobiaceae bacterium]|nr:DUF2541 domain-containing protein [Hyphomicrobiaceae bacterium]
MSRRLLLAGCAVAAAGFLSVAHAQQSGAEKWVLVGKGELDTGKASATIDVSKAKGAYKAVRLVNKRGDVEVLNVEVGFVNGAAATDLRPVKLSSGQRSSPIELKGDDKFLDKVTLTLKAGSGKSKKGLMEVHALQSAAGAKMARPASGQIAATQTTSTPTEAKPGSVIAGGDVMFGYQRVGFGIDRDAIRVGAEIGKFDKIRLRVLENDIFLNELKVVYVSGDPEVLAVNAEIKQNTRTKWLAIKGDRFIREIQMSYRSRPNFKGLARIEVSGDYAPNWLGARGEGRKYNQGWVLLGAKTAGFVGFDDEAIQVGRNEGGFKRIRVSVKDRAVTLNELRVVYENGSEDVIPAKSRVEADSYYGPVDLKSGSRAIKEIRAKYRSRFFDTGAVGKGAATVEVWGQH